MMKKFALFAMLLCSCMMYGCTKPKEKPAGEEDKPAASDTGTPAASEPAADTGGGGGEATE
jgi:hypothetical protein